MTKTKIILPVLMAVIIASTIGVVSAVDPVTDDGKTTDFIMAFTDFNSTATYGGTPESNQINSSEIIYFSEHRLKNTPDSRTAWLNGEVLMQAMIVDAKTDGNTFEFTWLVYHKDRAATEIGTSEIVVNGVCNVSDYVNYYINPYVTFTTINGTLQISPNEVPSPVNGMYSQFTSVCQTP